MGKSKLRKDLLNNDLISYNPKQWSINLPFKDYSFRIEDIVPALSGAIGKISLVAAFAVAWAAGFSIADPSFVTENVRLEIVFASILTILFCAVLNPYAGPPGTLAPLIPIIPAMILSGVHPLPLSILIGLMGIIISAFKYFSAVVEINGAGTKGGIILLFGFLGISSSFENLRNWTQESNSPELFVLLLMTGLVIYILLNKLRLKWLIIPTCAIAAIVISSLFGVFPTLKTGIGLPIINPSVWWNEKWGIGWGLNIENFIKALPFALLAVVMWPIDALAIKTIQESNYPKEAKKAVFDMNSTYIIVSIRNIIGTLLGGGQIAAIWRSFMIPLGIVKRPIGASAFVLGIIGVGFGILGFPIDIAVFPPLLWLVLIFGIYIPLLEVGLSTIKTAASAQIAAVCLIAGIAVNPVLGWITSVLVENFKIIKDSESDRIVTSKDRIITIVLIIVIVIAYLSTYVL
ncbi:MAG: DUF3360 family protein [Bacillota bacterium]